MSNEIDIASFGGKEGLLAAYDAVDKLPLRDIDNPFSELDMLRRHEGARAAIKAYLSAVGANPIPIPQKPGMVTEAMVEAAAAEYAKATRYYVEFHKGLRSESSDKIRAGIRAALSAVTVGQKDEAVATLHRAEDGKDRLLSHGWVPDLIGYSSTPLYTSPPSPHRVEARKVNWPDWATDKHIAEGILDEAETILSLVIHGHEEQIAEHTGAIKSYAGTLLTRENHRDKYTSSASLSALQSMIEKCAKIAAEFPYMGEATGREIAAVIRALARKAAP